MSPFDPSGRRQGSQGLPRELEGPGRGHDTGPRAGSNTQSPVSQTVSHPDGRSARNRARHGSKPGENSGRFVLYVEGPRDRDILRVWAHRLSPRLARSLDPCAVILGGRRPARALEHFRGLGGAEAGVKGLVVLDRDHHTDRDRVLVGESALELFTWSRRHIESYVLIPDAIRRLLGRTQEDSRAERVIVDHLPALGDEETLRALNAKRLLGSKGPFARQLGEGLSPGDIARCMHSDELHADVLALFGRIREGLGLPEPRCEVIWRGSRS